ncbi:hypothetical protein [Pseudomonas sp. UMAB-40]|uniref:hypothetical protein n=1 Tax=Pseudomonas sp. UMAB-40 TaxID=1365407 RepID=UPI001C5A45B6|nr:hypothetical protein [Pseudomonas sp. UMAB-40]
MKPTRETYSELQQAYDFLNTELFESRLPETMITLQRQHDTYGYFSANQFVNMGSGENTHEIALNPIYFVVRSIPETLSVLAREMVTLDLLLNSGSKPPRRRYRNKEWADMCESIGLMPTDTGKPGGRRTGDSVETYIIEGGLFDLATQRLLETDFQLSWMDRFPPQMPADEELPFERDESIKSLAHAEAPAEGTKTSLDTLIAAYEAEGEEGGETTSVDGPDKELPQGPNINAFAPEHNPAPAADSKQAPDAPKMKVFVHAQPDQLAQLGIEQRTAPKNLSKSKFQCPHPPCKGNAWGRPALRFWCTGTEKKPHEIMQMNPDGVETSAEEQPEGGDGE